MATTFRQSFGQTLIAAFPKHWPRSAARRAEVYSAAHDSFDPARLTLLGQIRPALERDEFVLHYQPKLDLQTGRIAGVEALLRWRHPEHGLLAPLRFIPLVEQTALIGPVTLHVVAKALRQASRWRELGLDVAMAVNLSARNLLDPDLPAQIENLLREQSIPAGELTVEVTESATLSDPDRAVRVLSALKAGGVGVSIDDFGTGNASIEYLARLPADEIKIDRSFVTDLCEDRRAEAIVHSTIDLARHLELNVVAEGIETEAVLDHLAGLGCGTGQGYFISPPLPADEITARLLDELRSSTAVHAGAAPARTAPSPIPRPARPPVSARSRSWAR